MTDTWYDPMHPAKPNSPMWRIVIVGAGLFVATFFLVPALVFSFILWLNRPPSQIEFDAQVWRDSPGQEVRWRMHADLVNSGQLEGKTLDEVVSLLGPAQEFGLGDDRSLEYRMGLEQESMFRIDSVWLLLYFDDDGVFQRHEVATD
jgi:hypothetical protein